MIVTVKEVIRYAEQFEERLADHYANLAEHAQREGVRLVARYMSQHHRMMVEALRNLCLDEDWRLSTVLLQFGPDAVDCHICDGMELPSGASAAEMLDAAVMLDDCLLRFYRQVLDQPVPPEVEDLFDSLCLFETADKVTLKKIKATDYF
jgi:hypothetical protein